MGSCSADRKNASGHDRSMRAGRYLAGRRIEDRGGREPKHRKLPERAKPPEGGGFQTADKGSKISDRHARACPEHLQTIDVYRSSAQGRGWRRAGNEVCRQAESRRRAAALFL